MCWSVQWLCGASCSTCSEGGAFHRFCKPHLLPPRGRDPHVLVEVLHAAQVPQSAVDRFERVAVEHHRLVPDEHADGRATVAPQPRVLPGWP